MFWQIFLESAGMIAMTLAVGLVAYRLLHHNSNK